VNTQLGIGNDGLIVEFGIDNRGHRVNVRIPTTEHDAVLNVVGDDADDNHDEDAQGVSQDKDQPVS
jgi:hypothetical protein